MTTYPEGYEPRLFIAKACADLGADVKYDAPTVKTKYGDEIKDTPVPGFTINGQLVVYLLDNRMPDNQWQNDAARELIETHNALICCAQKVDANQNGFKWLPLAVTPGYAFQQLMVQCPACNGVGRPGGHSCPVCDEVCKVPAPDNSIFDIAFVGYLNDKPRKMLMERIEQDFSCNIRSGVFGDEANQVYASGRLGLNVTAYYGATIAHDVNMRVFEIAACNRPLVTPRVAGMSTLGFRHGENCLMYENGVELDYGLRTALANQNFRIELAEEGHELVMSKHTYKHRAEQLLGWLKDGN